MDTPDRSTLGEVADATALPPEVTEAVQDALQPFRDQDIAQSYTSPEAVTVTPPGAEAEQKQAYQSANPPVRSYNAGQPWANNGESPHSKPAPEAPPSFPRSDPLSYAPQRSQEPRTLEDLYYKYSISDGQHYLSIKRLEPKRFEGENVAGFLEHVFRPIPTTEFIHRYGGEKYEVLVCGPSEKGDRKIVTKTSLIITIPGAPNVESLPGTEHEDPMTMQQFGRTSHGRPFVTLPGEDPEVAKTRMQIEAEDRRRAETERATLMERAARMPESVLSEVSRSGQQQVLYIQEQAKVQVDAARADAIASRERAERVEGELAAVRTKLLEAQGEAQRNLALTETTRTKEIEQRISQQVIDLQARHKTEVDELKARHKTEVDELKERAGVLERDLRTRWKEELDVARKSHDDETRRIRDDFDGKLRDRESERQRLVETEQRERERLRDDARNREQTIKDQLQMQLESIKGTYEARIHDLERNTQREIAAVKESRDREISAMKTQYDSQEKSSKEISSFKISGTENELTRLRSELNRVERENDELKAQVHKPFLQALEEAKQTAETLGYQQGAEKEEAADGEFDWKKEVARGVQSLIAQGPEVMAKLTEMRAQTAAQRAAAGPPQGGGQPPQQMGPPPMVRTPQGRRLPPSMTQQSPPQARWPGGMPPVPGTPPPYMPPPTDGPPTMQPMGIGPPPAVITADMRMPPAEPPVAGTQTSFRLAPSPIQGPQPPMQQPEPAQAGTPLWSPPPESATATPSQAPPQVVPPQPPQPVPQQQQPPPGAQGGGVPQNAIVEFTSALDQVIRSQMLSERQFAEAVVERIDQAYGRQATLQVMASITSDQYIELVNSMPGGQNSEIVTRGGQKFTRNVWAEAAKILGIAAPPA